MKHNDQAELVLPDILREHEADLVTALAKTIPGSWPRNRELESAEQPAAIGTVLVEAIHETLKPASLAYAFRKEMKRNGKTVLARASLGGAKLGFFSGIDLVVEVNWEAWRLLTREQRIALIDHELRHFVRLDGEGEEFIYAIVGHDIEEFGDIVKRWGLWQPDLVRFAAPMVRAAQQLDLLVTREPQTR